ncbi:chemotaxis protein CheW [Pseudomonas orientalis]|uniref:chemotaxis protein CheW n=1 Tax=Pseudomonas orientalis TaxID=76758 RepID=UPI000F58CACA|nr:chemotaxis protein CheW [Pseudomonas orientalis]AZE87937.1 Chemotaxis signal transduction protein [Pseudomonas orientalis]
MSSPDALDTAGLDLTLADTQAIDDCWNRIGIHGDKSCPLLADHIHCRNCSVYSAAATRLLDRYALAQDERPAQAARELDNQVATRSLLMFRLGEEWLGIATRCLVEVVPLQPIHSLPHQRSRALLGVANVRGALVACLSLVELLGLDSTPAGATGGRIMPRMLIIAAQDGPVVVPVDEVDGIHAIDERTLSAASASGTQASARFTQGVLQWKGRSLRWLDEAQLLSAVARSFA